MFRITTSHLQKGFVKQPDQMLLSTISATTVICSPFKFPPNAFSPSHPFCFVHHWTGLFLTSAFLHFMHLPTISRVVHGSHFSAIFGSFSCIWQRNKQKGIKNDVKNDVKNGYREHPGKENLEKCIFPSRHTAKKMKNDHFPGPFLQQQG